MEKLGVPSVAIVGDIFADVAVMGHRKQGFAELPMMVWPQGYGEEWVGYEDPRATILETIDEIIYDLTKWAPEVSGKLTILPEPVTFLYEGVDYQDALSKMNDDFLLRTWGDGLPLLPATEERVEWLLTGTDLAPDELIPDLAIQPSGMLATPRTIAINAAMAGARPEYMPVIIAALQATSGRVGFSGTNPAVPVLVVNGPIAKEIGMNSSWNFLGPSSTYPANGAIGRTLMTLGHTAGQAAGGITNLTPSGQPAHYNGVVFAEAEDRSPWEPLNAELGFAPGTNTVTCCGRAQGIINVAGMMEAGNCGEYLKGHLSRQMAFGHSNWKKAADTPENRSATLNVSAEGAKAMADLGYSKGDVKEMIWEASQIPLAYYEELAGDYIEGGRTNPEFTTRWEAYISGAGQWLEPYTNLPLDTMVPIAPSPNSFVVVVSGGQLFNHFTWFVHYPGDLKAAEIQTPANWAEILNEAPKFWEGVSF